MNQTHNLLKLRNTPYNIGFQKLPKAEFNFNNLIMTTSSIGSERKKRKLLHIEFNLIMFLIIFYKNLLVLYVILVNRSTINKKNWFKTGLKQVLQSTEPKPI